MIETNFKKELAKVQREYFSKDITDDEIFALNSNILCSVTSTLVINNYDNMALTKLLAFYLMNSEDGEDIKKAMADEVQQFVRLADCINGNRTELQIINAALDNYEEDDNSGEKN